MGFLTDVSVASNFRRIEWFNSVKDSLRASALQKMRSSGMTRSVKTEEWELRQKERDGMQMVWSRTFLPEVSVCWSQRAPYNCKMSPECTDPDYDYRFPAGCGVIAVAHALAYNEPKLSIYGQQVDWKSLKRQREITKSSSKSQQNQVGLLIKWIGEKVNAQYSCEGTSTKEAIWKIQDYADIKCDKQRNWNWNDVYTSLKNGRLVECNAQHKNENGSFEGHSWIIDGYVIGSYQGFKENYVHHHFGWKSGVDDGFFLVDDEVCFETSQYIFNYYMRIHPNITKK